MKKKMRLVYGFSPIKEKIMKMELLIIFRHIIKLCCHPIGWLFHVYMCAN